MLLRVREVCSLDWSNEYNSTNDIHPVASRNGSLVPYLAARRNVFVNANTYFSTSMFSEKCYGLQSSSRKRRQKILRSSIRIVSSPQSFNVPLAGFFGRLSWITRSIALKPAVLGWKFLRQNLWRCKTFRRGSLPLLQAIMGEGAPNNHTERS